MKTISLLGVLAVAACTPSVKQVSIEPEQATVTSKGEPLQIHAVAKDSDGAAVSTAQLVWSSSAPATASVDATGRVLALRSGTTRITAAVGDVKGVSEIKVQILGSLSISPASTTLTGLGQTAQLRLSAKDDAGNAIEATPAVWSSSNPKLATVDASGKVLSSGTGNVTISARSGAVTATAQVTVEPPASKAKSRSRKHRRRLHRPRNQSRAGRFERRGDPP